MLYVYASSTLGTLLVYQLLTVIHIIWDKKNVFLPTLVAARSVHGSDDHQSQAARRAVST